MELDVNIWLLHHRFAMIIFGPPTAPWATVVRRFKPVNDTVRGGASTSSLEVEGEGVVFKGNLGALPPLLTGDRSSLNCAMIL